MIRFRFVVHGEDHEQLWDNAIAFIREVVGFRPGVVLDLDAFPFSTPEGEGKNAVPTMWRARVTAIVKMEQP